MLLRIYFQKHVLVEVSSTPVTSFDCSKLSAENGTSYGSHTRRRRKIRISEASSCIVQETIRTTNLRQYGRDFQGGYASIIANRRTRAPFRSRADSLPEFALVPVSEKVAVRYDPVSEKHHQVLTGRAFCMSGRCFREHKQPACR